MLALIANSYTNLREFALSTNECPMVGAAALSVESEIAR